MIKSVEIQTPISGFILIQNRFYDRKTGSNAFMTSYDTQRLKLINQVLIILPENCCKVVHLFVNKKLHSASWEPSEQNFAKSDLSTKKCCVNFVDWQKCKGQIN